MLIDILNCLFHSYFLLRNEFQSNINHQSKPQQQQHLYSDAANLCYRNALLVAAVVVFGV